MKSYINKDYRLPFPKARGEISDIGYPCYADTKYDGELNFVIKKNGKLLMMNKDKYGRYREDFPVLQELSIIPDNTVLCGELYIGENVYDFLRNRDNDELMFAVFDMWEFDTIINNNQETINNYCPKDKKQYRERRTELESFLAGKCLKHVHLSECKIVNNYQELEDFRNKQIARGAEGLIAKAGGSLWNGADTTQWTKLKKQATADLVVMGYSRKAKYLSILLGYYDASGKLKALCGCGSGFSQAQKEQYHGLLESERLSDNKQWDKKYILTEPKHVVEVQYQEIVYMHGQISAIRHPIFVRWREDKNINEVSFK